VFENRGGRSGELATSRALKLTSNRARPSMRGLSGLHGRPLGRGSRIITTRHVTDAEGELESRASSATRQGWTTVPPGTAGHFTL